MTVDDTSAPGHASPPEDCTIHRLADCRAGSAAGRSGADDPRTAPDPDEATQWKLLAERAGHVLDALEAIAAGKRRPGLSAVAAEAAGLRDALGDALPRMIAVEAIWDDGYAMGLASQQGRASRPQASPRRSHSHPVGG